MTPDIQTELTQLKTELLEGMRGYMEALRADGNDPGYAEADIALCDAILADYLHQVSHAKAGDTRQVMAAVEEAVLGLNALSERCESLIETDQREQICELIDRAAAAVGVGNGIGEDLAGQWREW